MLSTVGITDITFLSGLESVVLPVSQKRCTTASFTRAGILAICSRVVYSDVTDRSDSTAGSSRLCVLSTRAGLIWHHTCLRLLFSAVV